MPRARRCVGAPVKRSIVCDTCDAVYFAERAGSCRHCLALAKEQQRDAPHEHEAAPSQRDPSRADLRQELLCGALVSLALDGALGALWWLSDRKREFELFALNLRHGCKMARDSDANEVANP